ncbi:radical SAM family heme chaperone HemW [Alkalihalobacterium bogoriense]|uniref:radical SAM family heme chaperone HemW n=1 Tax=Alkalihalobacterium bogoriense TaxID=246272 RepID=UPI00047CF3C6|nr:radical SAM family heme chaperone HemW [Alkalihalobacterium bogoriense]
MPNALYVHIPFCEHICHYCDFNKVFLHGQPVDEYMTALEDEMERVLQNRDVPFIDSIYIGGGTPTALSVEQLDRLLTSMRRLFPRISDHVEWTVEVNPGGDLREKLQVMFEKGVNRLSIGAQTFDEGLLHKIGRTHNQTDVLETIEQAKHIGFTNLSVDLMFGLPGQTMDMFKQTLESACKLSVEHFSAYSLKVEEKTVFFNMQRKGKLQLPPEEEELNMYKFLIEQMSEHRFLPYEISNFAKKGFESRHNLTYWNNDEYFGFGAGAHGYVDGVRYANVGPVTKYIQLARDNKKPILESHSVSPREAMEEFMFMGLRKRKGVEKKQFFTRYGQVIDNVYGTKIRKLKEKGWLEETEKSIYLTETGLFLSNEVFEQFLIE